jgi:HAD superfamily hydrolase (TIGR01509 family)
MITTIFFDNDGVLVDSEKYYCEANQVTCARYGYDLSRAEYQRLFLAAGSGLRHVGERIGWSEEKLATVRAERDVLYGDMLKTRAIVMPQVKDGLERLSKRFALCIVTSSPRPFFNIIHERTGFSRFFTRVISEENVTKHKPDPEPYLIALQSMAVTPRSGIAVEDSTRGLRSATAAGLRCIAAPRELTIDQDFSGACAVAEDFNAVVSIIERMAADADAIITSEFQAVHSSYDHHFSSSNKDIL